MAAIAVQRRLSRYVNGPRDIPTALRCTKSSHGTCGILTTTDGIVALCFRCVRELDSVRRARYWPCSRFADRSCLLKVVSFRLVLHICTHTHTYVRLGGTDNYVHSRRTALTQEILFYRLNEFPIGNCKVVHRHVAVRRATFSAVCVHVNAKKASVLLNEQCFITGIIQFLLPVLLLLLLLPPRRRGRCRRRCHCPHCVTMLLRLSATERSSLLIKSVTTLCD